MDKIKVIITSGIPGSGKTTWAKDMEGWGFVRVSTDDIRNGIFGDKKDISDTTQNSLVWEAFAEEARSEIVKIIYGKSNKAGVVCECMATNINLLSFVHREVILRINDIFNIDVDFYYKRFDVSPEECRKRIESDISNGIIRADISLEELESLDKMKNDVLSGIKYLESIGIKEYTEDIKRDEEMRQFTNKIADIIRDGNLDQFDFEDDMLLTWKDYRAFLEKMYAELGSTEFVRYGVAFIVDILSDKKLSKKELDNLLYLQQSAFLLLLERKGIHIDEGSIMLREQIGNAEKYTAEIINRMKSRNNNRERFKSENI